MHLFTVASGTTIAEPLATFDTLYRSQREAGERALDRAVVWLVNLCNTSVTKQRVATRYEHNRFKIYGHPRSGACAHRQEADERMNAQANGSVPC